MVSLTGLVIGVIVWFFFRCVLTGIYTVDQNERAVKTIFGRAERIGNGTTADNPAFRAMSADDGHRYIYPLVRVIRPGGPYFRMPWEQIHKASIATNTLNVAFDPDNSMVNHNGQILDAVTKDQLNIGLRGQLRFTVSEQNLYAYLFGIKFPAAHILGYFISILREKISVFEARKTDIGLSQQTMNASFFPQETQGISVNDLRKNISELNSQMELECRPSIPRYGVKLDAILITEIDPPPEVESALAAINTAINQVSSEVSRAKAAADQKIVQSRKAVEIETLKAEAETQMLEQLAQQLKVMKSKGDHVLPLYLRNFRLPLFSQIKRMVVIGEKGQS